MTLSQLLNLKCYWKKKKRFIPQTEFPCGSVGKDPACNARDLGSIPGLGRSPGEGNSNPFQYSFLENPHGPRSLASYSLWSCKESDTTQQLSTFLKLYLLQPQLFQWLGLFYLIFSSFQFGHSVVSDSLRSHGLQHIRLPCPSPTSGACSNSCPSSR